MSAIQTTRGVPFAPGTATTERERRAKINAQIEQCYHERAHLVLKEQKRRGQRRRRSSV